MSQVGRLRPSLAGDAYPGGVSTDPRLIPDRHRFGAWIVRIDGTDQSYVDPYDPTYLEFEYVQRIVDVIDTTFSAPARLAAIHIGGAGMTIPRYIAHTRPTSAQIVFEPDETLTEAVRDVAPLPRNSGIKVRPFDGRSGMRALASDYADLVVLDAFQAGSVPGELATVECFEDVRRILRRAGTLVINLTDEAPFTFTTRLLAGVAPLFRPIALGAEPSTLKGRRFGNIVIAAGGNIEPELLVRLASAAVFPYRILYGLELDRWADGAKPFTDADNHPSPPPPDTLTTFR